MVAAGGALTEIAGQNVVLTYTNVATEYEAIRRRAIVLNRSHRGRMRFVGEKAAEVLNGLLTNDVATLAPGQGQYAAALTPKGKVAADLRVLRIEDGFLTDASPRAADGWQAIVKKYVNPRLAKYTNEAATLSAIGVYGVQARYVIEEMTGIGHSALALLQPFAHVSVGTPEGTVRVMRSPDLEVEGFDVFVPSTRYEQAWEAAVKAHATPAGLKAWDIARVEAGRPEWGLDMDDSTIPQEGNLEELGAISYTKGCYTGQEVVARVHFRGHVNRQLRGLRSAGTTPLPSGASLFDANGKAVGEVRTSVTSPRLGTIALAMIRREVDIGAQLKARWGGDAGGDASAGEVLVDVVALPFATDVAKT